MRNFYLIDCVNCGHQTEVDLDIPGDTCLFCSKDARKKEVIMKENEGMAPVPPKPKTRKEIKAYWNRNEEAILADYKSMRILDFLKRWEIATGTWVRLKKLWGVQGKSKSGGGRRALKAAPEVKPDPEPEDTAPLTEHERYLILLGYQQAVREFLK